ncbi:PorT family protein [Polaribacter sp. WD7]|uniref:porin family protein n=1 Tax=Polaribacter sp. WD7 TaxID=2269061 RepID=UPI000DF18E8B|nr:porin family protein [Polaribacter sp. WD7]RCS28519.1 PorT family protein [Polaribacter sp. WD7]
MKRKLFIVGILILTISTYSQSTKIKFGLKGGINLFNFRIEQPEKHLKTEINSNFNVGFFTGIFVNYSFTDKIQIQIEPNFQKKQTEISYFFKPGIDISNNQTSNEQNEKYKFSEYSIENPLVIRYSINEKIKIEGGFNIIYIFKEKYSEPVNFGSNKTTFDVNEFETGLIIGGIYNLSQKIVFNLRYNYSLNEKRGSLLNKRIINIGLEYTI